MDLKSKQLSIQEKLPINSNYKEGDINFLNEAPIWLSVSESAKIGGVGNKTIRRALQAKQVKFKIVGNRYFIEFFSLIKFLFTKTKLKNKLMQNGIGQYVENWKEF